MRTRLIAETDASGKVICVWMSRTGGRTARPVTVALAQSLALADVEVSGAPRDAIAAWVAERLRMTARATTRRHAG